MKDVNWLSGGPFFEVSILVANQQSRECLINACVQKLLALPNDVEIAGNIDADVKSFVEGNSDNFDINIWISVAGKRRARFFVAHLSDDIALIDFWFLGDEFSKKPITKKEMPKFKKFLSEILCVFDGIVGTLGWEQDCQCFFDTNNQYPHKDFSLKKLKTSANKEMPFGIEEVIKTDKCDF